MNRRGGKMGRISHNTIDARKILNLKRAKKVNLKKGFSLRSSRASTSSLPFIKKAFTKVPEKRVQLAKDGNILITAKATNSQVVPQPQEFSRNINLNVPSRNVPMQWAPADIGMDNLEQIGIDDLIDMESLPPAVVSTNVQPQNRRILSQRSLADEVLNMQNTMVADQVASAATNHCARIIVANLRSSVSKEDIMELFGDVGLVKNAEMVQPGTAIIEFYSREDAIQACSVYHNRLLDGQPMKCCLQTNATPQRISVSQRLGERIQSVTPIPQTSSLSSNPRSRYNPRDVRFTVKLT